MVKKCRPTGETPVPLIPNDPHTRHGSDIPHPTSDIDYASPMTLLSIAIQLRRDLARLRFGPPVTHVYNPLDYAFETYRCYLERFGQGRPEVVLVGMNP